MVPDSRLRGLLSDDSGTRLRLAAERVRNDAGQWIGRRGRQLALRSGALSPTRRRSEQSTRFHTPPARDLWGLSTCGAGPEIRLVGRSTALSKL